MTESQADLLIETLRNLHAVLCDLQADISKIAEGLEHARRVWHETRDEISEIPDALKRKEG